MSGGVDLEAHAEALILLGEDCADIHPGLLDEAARRWARDEKWMPKASELRELARSIQAEKRAATSYTDERLQAHCDLLNGYSWVQNSRDPYVVHTLGGKRQIMRRSTVKPGA